MAEKSYCYQFAEQKVFAPDHAPICFQIKGNVIIVAMMDYTVAVYDILDESFNLIKSFPVGGFIKMIDFCTLDDFIITLESKNNTEATSNVSNTVRSYHNWRNIDSNNKMRFRSAYKSKNNSFNVSNQIEYNNCEPVIEVLEFLDLSQPLCFALYTNDLNRRSFSNKNQVYEDMSSIIGISENTYVHFYRLSYQKISKPNLDSENSSSRSFCCFQHMYTVNFSFIIYYLSIHSQIIVTASKDRVQAIRILEEKQKLDKYTDEFQSNCLSSNDNIELEIEKCWLSSISSARKVNAAKQKARPREILGPTQNLDTASITMLRYPEKQISFETLLFRKYLNTTTTLDIKGIQLVKVNGFDEYGLFILRCQEIVQYCFHIKTGEIAKISEYDFKEETAIAMSFSDRVNLLHVAFSNGDLVTYNSAVCAVDLFQTSAISKILAFTRLNRVKLMGLTDVKSCGNNVLVSCMSDTDPVNDDKAFDLRKTRADSWVTFDSWNFYLFKQPRKDELKENIIKHAERKGIKKLLQMLFCSLLTFPNKEELNCDMIQRLIICCLRSELIYNEIVPHLLLRENLKISDALLIFQTLETKELYNDNLFKTYAKNKLLNANLKTLTEDQFRWIILKILACSIRLVFKFFITNQLQELLKVDLLIIESIKVHSFESAIIKILYYAAHDDFDITEPLIAYLDPNGLLEICVCYPHLIYYNNNHTSFGWLLNMANPQLYAQIIAKCFLSDAENTVPFKTLEFVKQVGQCSYILSLEEILYCYLLKNGILKSSNELLNYKSGYNKKVDNNNVENNNELVLRKHSDNLKNNKQNNNFDLTEQNQNVNNVIIENEEIHKYYVNLLIVLYHEYSFNGVEFCPHKMKQNCKKIPTWLKNLRYHSILNEFLPFNGSDPFLIPHKSTSDISICPSLCCQSYLIRLQCMLSWSESWGLQNIKVISTSCESKDHPAWQSLYFLLLISKPDNLKDHFNIIQYLESLCESNENNSTNLVLDEITPLTNSFEVSGNCVNESKVVLVDMFLKQFGGTIPVSCWERIIGDNSNVTSKSKKTSVSKMSTNQKITKYLEFACRSLPLHNYCHMLLSLRESEYISNTVCFHWIETAGRIANQNAVFDNALNQLMDELI